MPTAPLWSEVAGDPDTPPVVLVHGSMDRSAGLLRLSRRLDDEILVLRYDRRGYGRSIDAGPPFDVARQVDDLAEMLARRTPGRPAALVFGHSFGGNVALGLADRHPDLVGAVAVYETPLSWLDWWPADSAGGTAMRQDDPEAAAEAFMRRLLGDAIWERLPPSTRRSRRAEGAAMLGELADLRRQAPWSAERIEAPVLAMAGERGRDHHRRSAETLREVLPDCRVAIVEGAGHFGPNTHADAVTRQLRGFVRRG